MTDKTTTSTPTPAETPAAAIEGTIETSADGSVALEPYPYTPSDFEIRRTAVELATQAHEPHPLDAAPDYYEFLKGATATEAGA